jgi:hypothetical protein
LFVGFFALEIQKTGHRMQLNGAEKMMTRRKSRESTVNAHIAQKRFAGERGAGYNAVALQSEPRTRPVVPT